jgi:hypothetical protein
LMDTTRQNRFVISPGSRAELYQENDRRDQR